MREARDDRPPAPGRRGTDSRSEIRQGAKRHQETLGALRAVFALCRYGGVPPLVLEPALPAPVLPVVPLDVGADPFDIEPFDVPFDVEPFDLDPLAVEPFLFLFLS